MGHGITAGPGASLPCSGGSWAAWLMAKAGAWGTCQPSRCGGCSKEVADLSGSGGDFQGWRPDRIGKACLWVLCVRRLSTEGAPKHTGLMFVLPSQPGALATLTEQVHHVGKGTQSRDLHLLATECPRSLSQLPFWAVATGQGHSGSKVCPSPCCPPAGKVAWGTSCLDKQA